jgi:hypothetical protein
MDHDTAHDTTPASTESHSSAHNSSEPSTDKEYLPLADDASLSQADLESLRERDDLAVSSDTSRHDDFDHCATDIAGRVVVAVENEAGKLLVLCNDELGVILLPHGDVEAGDDYARTAREESEATTGISIALDGIDLLREVNHVVETDGKPHRTTYRVIFRAHPVSGAIQECKQSHDTGSEDWDARWVTTIPDGFDAPDGGPGDDIRYALQ